MNESSEGLSPHWQQLINAELLPLSGQTIRMLEEGLNRPGLSFKHIVPVVSNDAALAAMLFRRAATKMATSQFDVVEAINALGKPGIRAIIATAPLLRFYPADMQREYQKLQLQGAFASRQSHALQAIYANDTNSAIDIAALLSCIAELQLATARSAQMDLLRQAAQQRNMDVLALTERLIRKPIAALNAEMHKALFQQPQLAQALLDSPPTMPELRALRFGYQLAREVARGWQSREFAGVIHNIAKTFNSDTSTVFSQAQHAMLRLQAEGFATDTNLAKDFINANFKLLKEHLELIRDLEEEIPDIGVETAPAPRAVKSSASSVNAETTETVGATDDAELADAMPNPDQERAIKGVVRKIDTQSDVNLVLKTVAEAVFQSLDFKRVTLALCNPQRTVVKSRYQFGKDTATWSKNFSFSIQKQDDNLIAWSVNLRKTMRVKTATFEPKELINDRFRMIINHSPECVVGPLVCDNKPVAIIYADLGIKSDARISGEQYKAFSRLVEDANRRLAKLKP